MTTGPADLYTPAAHMNGAAVPDPAWMEEMSIPSAEADVGAQPAQTKRTPATVASVLESWRTQGPTIREPLGLPALDAILGGGLPYGSRGIVTGAPDAGKTLAVAVHFAATFASRGVVVGVHSIDDEADDDVGRYMQRLGFERRECEARGEIIDSMIEKSSELGEIYFYDSSYCIEEAAANVFELARGRPAAYLLDSVQVGECRKIRTADREPSQRDRVAANMFALRDVAKRYRMVVVGTSEENRASYGKQNGAEKTSDNATGAESRAIEYQARWLIRLVSVKGESDLVQVVVAKNKIGVGLSSDVYLRLDRVRQSVAETVYEPAGAEDEGDALDEDVVAIRKIILEVGVVAGTTGLRSAVRAAKLTISNDRIGAAIVVLRRSGELVEGGKSNRPKWSIQGVQT